MAVNEGEFANPLPSTELNPTYIEKQKILPNDIIERRRRYLIRWTSMKAERGRQWTKWQDLADYILPERGRFLSSDHNRPKNTSRILNNQPTRSARALAAALMSGGTSPARPWFRMTVQDYRIATDPDCKIWLWLVEELIRKTLDLSGFYKAAAQGVYPDIVTFGTAACAQEEDFDQIMRFVPYAMGSFALAQDGKQRVNAFISEEAWSVGELVSEFGFDRCSASVRTAYNTNLLEQYILVLHIIAPNDQIIPGWPGRKGAPYSSVWMEVGGLGSASGALAEPSTDPTIGFLRESFYNEWPILAPRWSITSRDVYGTGPGHDALPDSRQLMKQESKALLAGAKGVDPAMLFPEAMRVGRLSALPGDPVYVPASAANFEVRPVFQPNPGLINEFEQKIRQTEARIDAAFFGNIVMMISGDQGVQPDTAEEIRAKQQEKMLQLGPVLENLNDEFLKPLINRTFNILLRRRMLPPAPKMLRGQELKIEFVSILAQAQKIIGTTGLERLLAFVGQVGTLVGPNAADNIDTDKMVQHYADMLGTPPDVMARIETMMANRKARAQQAQAQAQGQAIAVGAKAAKDASGASLDGNNLLSQLAGPQAGAQANGANGQ